MIRIKVKLSKGLKNLNAQSLKKALSVAVQRGAERYLEMIHDYIDSGKSFKPRTGNLQRSIGYRKVDDLTYRVFANAEYAPFVEFGTRPHTIFPKRAQALRFTVQGKRVFAKKVNHPGSKPYPFFYAEMDRRKEEVKNEFLKALKDWLEEVDE